MKLLHAEDGGMVMYVKRLEAGRFRKELSLLLQPRIGRKHVCHPVPAGHLPEPRHQSAPLPQLCHRRHAVLREGNRRRTARTAATQVERISSRGHHENICT